jgi:ABC-2 type transport system permease protein
MKVYLNNFLKFRFLLFELVINDIKVKYRRSVLGVLWSVLHPLMMMMVLTVVFSSLFKSDIPHFAVYVLTGRIIWDLYSQATIFSMSSIVNNAALIKKVYVPKYIFPLAKSFSSLVNTIFSLIALVIVMVISGVKVNFNILFFPLPLIYTFMFATGVGLIMSAYAVFFRDLNYLYEVLLTVWMYFTPLFYPISILPKEIQFTLQMNPLYHMLNMFREITIYGQTPSLVSNLLCFLIGASSLLVGFIVFYKKQDKFILYI